MRLYPKLLEIFSNHAMTLSKEELSYFSSLVEYCEGKRVLMLTTSTRWEKDETPKSTQIARGLAELISNSHIIEIPKLKIYVCEGNISKISGNNCGVKDSLLKDPVKNPSGYHRCWASYNNPDDELWKVTKELFQAEIILFFVSQRWGQTNSIFQKLIERLSWIENRKSTLEEDPIPVIQNQEVGMILLGHNWRVKETLDKELEVFRYFGWKTPNELSYSWQFTTPDDETQDGYLADPLFMEESLGIKFDK